MTHAAMNKRSRRARRRPWHPMQASGNVRKAHDRRAQELPADADIATIEVQNPLTTTGETDMIVAVRLLSRKSGSGDTLSRDHLAWLHAHRHIDDAQYHAGRKWQVLYERAAIGAVQSVDTSKEPVDGGRWPDLLTDNRAQASREVIRLAGVLGPFRAATVRDVLGLGLLISTVAAARGPATKWTARRLGAQLIEALEILAAEFGFANMPKRHGSA